jgi:hypothetical protein
MSFSKVFTTSLKGKWLPVGIVFCGVFYRLSFRLLSVLAKYNLQRWFVVQVFNKLVAVIYYRGRLGSNVFRKDALYEFYGLREFHV